MRAILYHTFVRVSLFLCKMIVPTFAFKFDAAILPGKVTVGTFQEGNSVPSLVCATARI